MSPQCPECGAVWNADQTCETYFHQMLFWENEDTSAAEVHHLMVLSYYLQHPSLYSPAGLVEGQRLLSEFVENGVTPTQIRQRNSARLNSNNRTWKIKATTAAHGAYPQSLRWAITAADVINGGASHYHDNVRRWANAIHTSLKALAAKT